MKILFISRYYKPHVGGVEKHVEKIISNLPEDIDVDVITERYSSNLKEKESILGDTVWRFSYPKIKLVGLMVIWCKLFKYLNLIRKADVIHIHDVFIWFLPYRILFPFKPIYITFHGWEGKYPIPIRNIFLNRLAYKLTQGNLCAGAFIEKYYGIKANRVYYTAIDKPRKKRFKKIKNKIVYVGRLDEDTGLEKILESLSYLKNIDVDFCGDGPLRDKCKKYGRVHGFVNPNPYFSRSMICLSAGLTSILEALSYRCIVITTYNYPIKKDYLLMTPFKNWVIVKNKPKDMAKEIKNLTGNPKKMDKKLDKAQKWVNTQTWEWLAGEYLKLWKLAEI